MQPLSFSAFALVFVGGGVGSLFRYLCSVLSSTLIGIPTPYVTMGINILGSLLIGYLRAFTRKRGLGNGLSTVFRCGLLWRLHNLLYILG